MHHVAGESDSYVIKSTDSNGTDYINSYGLGKLGMVELLCDCIDAAYKDDKVFAEWFKKQVADYFEVELRSEPISFEQSQKILSGEIDPTLNKIMKKIRTKGDLNDI